MRGLRRLLVVALGALFLLPPLPVRGEEEGARVPEKVRDEAEKLVTEIRDFRARNGKLGRVFDYLARGSEFVAEQFIRTKIQLWYVRPGDGKKADEALDAMFGELDSEQLAFFVSDVRDLADDPRVPRFLDDLIRHLAGSENRVDVWEIALAHTGGDVPEAMRWMAVLFQDLEITPFGHLRVIEEREMQNRLAVAILLITRSDPDRVRLYPDHLDIESRRLYHYYVPAHLAARLRKLGHEPKVAFLAPFALNAEYEQFKAKQIDDDPDREATVDDVYLGYRGAHRGAGRQDQPLDRDELARGIQEKPKQILRELTYRRKAPARKEF